MKRNEFNRNYLDRNTRYAGIYKSMHKQYPNELKHLLKTGLLLTAGKEPGYKGTGQYRKF